MVLIWLLLQRAQSFFFVSFPKMLTFNYTACVLAPCTTENLSYYSCLVLKKIPLFFLADLFYWLTCHAFSVIYLLKDFASTTPKVARKPLQFRNDSVSGKSFLWLKFLATHHSSGFSVIDLVVSQHNSHKKYAAKRIRCFSPDDVAKASNEGRLHVGLPDHKNLLPCFSYTERKLIPSPANQGAWAEILLLMPRCEVRMQHGY